MIIIIGLGNPGEKYQNTRHNIGFMVVDAFAKKNNFPNFKLQKKSNALVSESIVNDKKITLIKPQTFMNESGKAIADIIKPYSSEPKLKLMIVHDDIDLPVGKIKIVEERGSAGHKGVESIIKNVGNKGLTRFRVGISGQNEVKAMKVVLENFSEEEQKSIDEAIQKTVNALDLFLKEGIEKAMNKFN